MRILGVPVVSPQAVIGRAASDAGAAVRVIRSAPAQFERLLTIGEEIVQMGHRLAELGERLDARAGELTALGERLDGRAGELMELGVQINELGNKIDTRAGEIAERADEIVDTGNNLIVALPTLERALDLATPLEGAIDRVGRFVDRLPGGPNARRRPPGPPGSAPRSDAAGPGGASPETPARTTGAEAPAPTSTEDHPVEARPSPFSRPRPTSGDAPADAGPERNKPTPEGPRHPDAGGDFPGST